MQSGAMQTLRWMRVPGDIVFSIGAAAFAWFVLGLLTGHSYDNDRLVGPDASIQKAHEEHGAVPAGR